MCVCVSESVRVCVLVCVYNVCVSQERDWVLNEFKSGRHPIMIATDVAARGLGKHMCTCPKPGSFVTIPDADRPSFA